MCRRFAEKLGGTIQEIDAGHDVMLSKPVELTALLTRTSPNEADMETALQPGGTILIYTDGVTEAMNGGQELYSGERLMSTVKSSSALNAAKLAREVLDSVREFASGAPQSDDITVLALTFRSPK